MTAQRRLIVEHIYSHHDHFDADELMAHLQEAVRRREVSRPTVYRTLNEMVEAGLLRKMVLRGRSVYEHEYGYPQHDHLYCRVCHRLIEFQCTDLVALRDAVSKEHDFEAESHRMLITGICADCRQRQKSTSRE